MQSELDRTITRELNNGECVKPGSVTQILLNGSGLCVRMELVIMVPVVSLLSATAELDMASAHMSLVGSPSKVELDPVSRATQQYLEVLIKNKKI